MTLDDLLREAVNSSGSCGRTKLRLKAQHGQSQTA